MDIFDICIYRCLIFIDTDNIYPHKYRYEVDIDHRSVDIGDLTKLFFSL